ncbi:acyltransferase family protein [Pseudomonas sp. TE3610]
MTRTVNANLDRLKLVLAFVVVALHCKVMGGNDTTLGYVLCNGLFRVAVPVFFLINGYFLLHPLQSSAGYWVWLKRIIALYVFWMLVYSPFYVTGPSVGALLAAVKQWFIGFFHLWYLLGMLGGSVMLYVVRKRPTWQIAALALGLFIIGLLLQYARVYVTIPQPFLQHFNQNDYTARNFVFMGFPFVALGYLLAREQVVPRLSRPALWALLGVGVVLMVGESLFNLQHTTDRALNFDFMASLPLVAPALMLLALAYESPTHSTYMGRLSSAVYFAHPLFIYVAMAVGLAYGNLMALVVAILVTAAAPLIIAVSRRWRFVL